MSKLFRALGLSIFILGLATAPAAAAPSWEVSLTNTPGELPRTDERMEYVARVTNTGDVASSGTVTLTTELPGGFETTVYTVSGAGEAGTCSTEQPAGEIHAIVTCTRSFGVAAGSSYFLTIVAHLGEGSEDPGIATATVSGGGVASLATDTAEYHFEAGPGFPFGVLAGSFQAAALDKFGADDRPAGGHPFEAFATYGFNVHRAVNDEVFPTGAIKNMLVDTPRGFVGNALTAPELCKTIEDLLLDNCPEKSVVGGIDLYAHVGNFFSSIYPADKTFPNLPIYSLEPEFGQPAQFAVSVSSTYPYTFVPELRPDEGYSITFRTAPTLTAVPVHGVTVHLCDFGAKTSVFRQFEGCRDAAEPESYPHPLITNPTRCLGSRTAGLRINSWEHPEEFKTTEYTASGITSCEAVEFEPESELQPTNHQADSPTGLTVELKMPIDGVLSPTGLSQANLDTATVTLPKGMAINPSVVDGLGACGLEQIRLHSNAPDECPGPSKIGTIEIDTPLIRKTLTGSVYVARQNENPFNSPLGLYMSFASARDGVRVKVAGKIVPDPVTGQLTSIFTENPEWPFSRLALKFNSGARAPLINPPKCGTYAIHSEFSPWSAVNPANPTSEEIVSQESTYQVTSGPNGSPCPTGSLDPKLEAGVQDTQAGSKSPFVFTLSRDDGTQRFNKIDVRTPKGLTAHLKGIPYCSDAILAGISGAEGTGHQELTRPACPAASQVGSFRGGVGAGPYPFYAPGKVYLAGPYKGAPVSLAVVTPAVGGPFDLGNVVVRNPLYVDPTTAQVTTVSDPVPTILHGLLLDVRDIRVALDRPSFTQAPTNCEPMAIDARVSGQEGASAGVSSRFQVGGCRHLGFKPKLAFRLFGGTHRGSHPKLRAILMPRPGDASIAAATVTLPHSAFLDQGHIKTVCTRVQFAAKACPRGSVYGEAEAITPLLDKPLKGPVYLRSSDHQLPDLVMALQGPDAQPVEINVVGRIDSIHGGIRANFETVPDQPVTKFILTMQGGKKGLLVNSKDICASTSRATVNFTGQNGKTETSRPQMKSACAKHRKHSKQAHKRRRSH